MLIFSGGTSNDAPVSGSGAARGHRRACSRWRLSWNPARPALRRKRGGGRRPLHSVAERRCGGLRSPTTPCSPMSTGFARQYYGYGRLNPDPLQRYRLLYPLLDLTTTLDPRFVAARFGAIFLAEPDPGGGRPSRPCGEAPGKRCARNAGQMASTTTISACALLAPERLQGSGRVVQTRRRHTRAVPGGCAPTRRSCSPKAAIARLSGDVAKHAADRDNDWVRTSAQLRLTQLDALDQIDALSPVRDEFTRRRGTCRSRGRI
jgi:hypothetical protein